MAAETIGVELFAGIVFLVQKYCRIRCRMPSLSPLGIFLAMAAFAVLHRLQNIHFIKLDVFPLSFGEMVNNHHSLFLQAVKTVAERSPVALPAKKSAMAALGPHVGRAFNFMTTRACRLGGSRVPIICEASECEEEKKYQRRKGDQ